MSLHLNFDELLRQLNSASTDSTDEEMEFDNISITEEKSVQDEGGSDIEVNACYREVPILPRNWLWVEN